MCSNWLYVAPYSAFVWMFGEGLISPILQAPALPDMHMTAKAVNRKLPQAKQIAQEQAKNLVTSVFQTLRISGQAIGPLLGAPALVSIGFRWTITICGIIAFTMGFLAVVCYLSRLGDDDDEAEGGGAQQYAPLAEDDEKAGLVAGEEGRSNSNP
jgi:hypothetical protein